MARPSIKEQRKEEILTAYENCIALYGVEGATLQKVSEAAGIARPLLRHHVGNQKDLLLQATDRFIMRNGPNSTEQRETTTPEDFISSLFSEGLKEHNDISIASALIIAAQTNEDIKTKMQNWLLSTETYFQMVLKHFYPSAEHKEISICAAGVMGIYFNVASLQPLGKSTHLIATSKQAVQQLINNLK